MHTTSSPKNSIQIIEALGLDNRPLAGESSVEDVCLHRRAFDWVHLGTSDLRIGELVAFFEKNRILSAPRTGHLGNWVEIANGRSGALDCNDVVCRDSRLGYPLVYDCNQTEDRELRRGDSVYLPGSLVDRGHRTILPLWTWDGRQFRERSRETSLFVPFVRVPVDGDLVPLTRIHRARDSQLSAYALRYHSTVLRASEPQVREILSHLVEAAMEASNPAKALSRLFDQKAGIDGVVSRAPLRIEDGRVLMGDLTLTGTGEIVDALLLPLLAADDPDAFFDQIGWMPAAVPLLSPSVTLLLYALLNTHYAAGAEECGSDNELCVHLHWGADQMAGYPPLNLGYFASSARSMGKLHSGLLARRPDLPAIFYLLLPLSIFSLCPSDSAPADQELLESLLVQVGEALESSDRDIDRDLLIVQEIAHRWWERSRSDLSRYFIGSFSRRRSIHADIVVPESARPIIPHGLAALRMRDACLLVGVLHQVIC